LYRGILSSKSTPKDPEQLDVTVRKLYLSFATAVRLTARSCWQGIIFSYRVWWHLVLMTTKTSVLVKQKGPLLTK